MELQSIYERRFELAYRIAMLYIKNEHDAEDIVQEIFVTLMEKNIEFRDEEHEKAWFIRTTRNRCKDVFKNNWWKRVELCDAEIERPLEKKQGETDSELIKQIMKLSPKYREVLYLFYYEEYKIKEIGQILHRKESTVQTQLSTARKKLKEMIEKDKEENRK